MEWSSTKMLIKSIQYLSYIVLSHRYSKQNYFPSSNNDTYIFLLATQCSQKQSLQDVRKIFAKLTEKHLCQNLYFNSFVPNTPFIYPLRPATLLKKRPWHRCFTMNFAKFLRTPFIQNTSGRLLLTMGK